jgi:predicted aldo/keto reductase-like oxidoreductase
VARALAEWRGPRPTLASKSAAKDAAGMTRAVEEALMALNVEVIDVFCLHAVKDPDDLRAREGAVEALLEARRRGLIRAVGASSHWLGALRVLAGDPRIDVLHPMFNRQGVGLLDGSLDGMRQILQRARAAGQGIYAMKPLGGGHLRHQAVQALAWVLQQPEIDAAAVGMASVEEVTLNLAVARGQPVSPELASRVAQQSRRLFINEMLCQRCGRCVERCPQQALSRQPGEAEEAGRIGILYERCVLCGYCSADCPVFAIRVI